MPDNERREDRQYNVPVKVCGLREPETALACVEAGASAIGIVFYAPSPRAVAVSAARGISLALPPEIVPVGVFVDSPPDYVLRICEQACLRCVQLHGHESPVAVERIAAEGVRVVKVLRETGGALPEAAGRFAAASAFLVEAGRGCLPGGNAAAWNWGDARPLSGVAPFALAGGLTPANVVRALDAAHPDAIDVSSGVEESRGVKNLNLVTSFIRATKSYRPDSPPGRVFG